jgi:predicted enzyme related to lactoylglutathione lyase
MNPRFVRLLHRARDVAAARTFYAAVLGAGDLEIVPLPESAAARGAPSHWLGAIAVEDVAQAQTQLVARGATQLGPVQTDARGAFAVLRDPGGALVALTTPTTSTMPSAAPLRPATVWSHLDARDAESTFGVYAALFGWRSTERIELGSAGSMMRFSWEARGRSVGSYADLASRPGLHPHWLFYFLVASLDDAVRAVHAHRGVVLADVVTPNGARVVVCDDPHGGGFALSDDPEFAI